MDDDVRFMSQALELALRGRGAVEPNPMVGAVIVRDGVRLGWGWHRSFGGPHAEIEALADAAAGADVAGATMYVSLEPCCVHAKTPPCTGAIISAGLRRVVVAIEDPDERIRGRGIAALRAAGVEVDVGVCGDEARKALAAYIKSRTRRRPWVICKWAQTFNGLVSLPPDRGRWISGQDARAHVHELRAFCQGVCVGIGTVLADDPLLTNRSGRGRQPTRVVLDCRLRIRPDSRLVRSAGESPLMIATTGAAIAAAPRIVERLRSSGAELLELPAASGLIDLHALLDELGRRHWTYLLVEGGPAVLGSFIEADLADELMVFVSPKKNVVDSASLPHFDIAELGRRLRLPGPRECAFGDDTLLRFVLSSY